MSQIKDYIRLKELYKKYSQNNLKNHELEFMFSLYSKLVEKFRLKVKRIEKKYNLKTPRAVFRTLHSVNNTNFESYEFDNLEKLLGRDVDVFFSFSPKEKKVRKKIFYNNKELPIIRKKDKIYLFNPVPKQLKVKDKKTILRFYLDVNEIHPVHELLKQNTDNKLVGVIESWKDVKSISRKKYSKHLEKNSGASCYLDTKNVEMLENVVFNQGKGFKISGREERLFLYYKFKDFVGLDKTRVNKKTKWLKLQIDRFRKNNTTKVNYHGYPILEEKALNEIRSNCNKLNLF